MLILLQILVSIILIALILIQERSSGLSGILGGGLNSPYQTRRGVEKTIFMATIVSGAAFAVLALVNLLF